MASKKVSWCGHVTSIGRLSWEDIKSAQKHEVCDTCRVKAPNLWLCLVGDCAYIGCGESVQDHSSSHAESTNHCLTINLSTRRIWCYRCETEVFHDKNTPPFLIPERQEVMGVGEEGTPDVTPELSPHHVTLLRTTDSDDSDPDDDPQHNKPRGLTGLQNLGNTCYLNAAVQALSNCAPLTRFFLDCPGFVHPDKSPQMSKYYRKLMTEIWHKNRPSYLVPSSIVSGIKVVHPMFRGYSQQDTQEFLRCFMDQLHEELKQPITDEHEEKEEESTLQKHTSSAVIGPRNTDGQLSMDTSSTSSQSEYDYETCDSAIGSERDINEQGVSSDESGEVNELSKLTEKKLTTNYSDRRPKVHKGRITRSMDRNLSSPENLGGLSGLRSKKDVVNRSVQSLSETSSMYSDDQRSDSGEYVDAETEPLRARRAGRTTSGSNDARDSHPRPSRQKNTPIHSPGMVKSVQYRSVISDIFDGKLSSSVQCLTCERVSTTKETFQDLSLPIPSKDHVTMLHASSHGAAGAGMLGAGKSGACSEVQQGWIHSIFGWMRSWFLGPVVTLQDCLGAFFSADELKGDNMYSCEKCKKLRNGLKYSKVLNLPEVLCVHLKRFRHEFYSSKISTYVSFPLSNLDMKYYLHKDHTSAVTTYDLFAVICHHGTAGGGHYTAYCQNMVTDQWYEYDDQYVTEVDVSQVINCEAYVLFYRKQNDHMSGMRQKALDLMNKHEPSLMQFYVSKQWINRFNMFAEPGPITNEDFLCPHGGVPPSKTAHISDMVLPLSQQMWEFLHERFGGGPACNHVFACVTCHKERELLRCRQQTELDEFIKLNERFKDEDNPSVIYAISMSWFKEWENFVREKEDCPPGPIDNKRISVVKAGQLCVRSNSDHGQLSGEMWNFLYDIYGGGPELVIKQVIQHPATLAAQARAYADQSKTPAQPVQSKSPPTSEARSKTQTTSEAQPKNPSTSDEQSKTPTDPAKQSTTSTYPEDQSKTLTESEEQPKTLTNSETQSKTQTTTEASSDTKRVFPVLVSPDSTEQTGSSYNQLEGTSSNTEEPHIDRIERDVDQVS